ncbi:putative membrane protein [Vibrio parahaemolyticus]|nr:hypothetical protein VPUCM_p0025 [Vibrio parahaemolyticus UCM-V493]OQK18935.1 putative membrane protein [Vibrio parahaemolyticus]
MEWFLIFGCPLLGAVGATLGFVLRKNALTFTSLVLGTSLCTYGLYFSNFALFK